MLQSSFRFLGKIFLAAFESTSFPALPEALAIAVDDLLINFRLVAFFKLDVTEGPGCVGAGPEGHEDDQRAGAPLL